jgi:glycosyltransferase involved in cell wall biosynthesis
MRRPVIATDLGGPSETVRHGETGWLTIPGDPRSLAAALAAALAMDHEARRAMGARARESVMRGYTVQAMREATLDVYEAVLSGKALQPAA